MRAVGWDSRGQSSVEYALVTMAFLAVVLALACLWRAGRSGALLSRATSAASHQMGGSDVLGSMRDVALY